MTVSPRATVIVVLMSLTAAAACSDTTQPTAPTAAATAPTTTSVPRVAAAISTLLPLHVGPQTDPSLPAPIMDSHGREVLLRGVNLNSLGDYYQANTAFDPVAPVTDADWDEMAAHGISVVRLLMSWSALEPTRGNFDDAYLDRIRGAVAAAGSRGIYVVLDMHQDAYGKFIATPTGTACTPGTEAAIGWDGAPQWATLTGGADTCRSPGVRESAPAVAAAFGALYENHEGIRDELAATWQHVATAFASDPTVAGYDLLNEPSSNAVVDDLTGRYTQLVASLLSAVRTGERAGGGFTHLAVVEPIVGFPLPNTMPTMPTGEAESLVFAPHNYAEAIGPTIITIEQTYDIDAQKAADLGAALWIGEYGWWDTEPPTVAKLARYAAAEDAHLAAGAWWQWRQACGDPHSVAQPGATPGDQTHLHRSICPANTDGGPTPEFFALVGRPYPRATPGRLTALSAGPAMRSLQLSGIAPATPDVDAPLVVWFPGDAEHPPTVQSVGLVDVVTERSPGGWYITARATGDFTLSAS